MAPVIMGCREGWACLLDMYIIMAKILRKTALWGIKSGEGFIMCVDEEMIIEYPSSPCLKPDTQLSLVYTSTCWNKCNISGIQECAEQRLKEKFRQKWEFCHHLLVAWLSLFCRTQKDFYHIKAYSYTLKTVGLKN